jgi:hypothetical protein
MYVLSSHYFQDGFGMTFEQCRVQQPQLFSKITTAFHRLTDVPVKYFLSTHQPYPPPETYLGFIKCCWYFCEALEALMSQNIQVGLSCIIMSLLAEPAYYYPRSPGSEASCDLLCVCVRQHWDWVRSTYLLPGATQENVVAALKVMLTPAKACAAFLGVHDPYVRELRADIYRALEPFNIPNYSYNYNAAYYARSEFDTALSSSSAHTLRSPITNVPAFDASQFQYLVGDITALTPERRILRGLPDQNGKAPTASNLPAETLHDRYVRLVSAAMPLFVPDKQ